MVTRTEVVEEMAKNTARLVQELKEAVLKIAESQGELKKEMEQNQQKNDARMDEFNRTVTSLLRRISDLEKGKGIESSGETQSQISHERASDSCEQVRPVRNPYVKVKRPTLEFPSFDGSEVRNWIRRCRIFFHFHSFSEVDKFNFAAFHLKGRADRWLQDYEMLGGAQKWEEFAQAVAEKFDSFGHEDLIGEFKNFKQENSVQDYEECFDELKHLMLVKYPFLTEDYFVSSFISGLKEEIKFTVRLFDPRTLTHAMYLARTQEKRVPHTS